jgi:hypothetical protein
MEEGGLDDTVGVVRKRKLWEGSVSVGLSLSLLVDLRRAGANNFERKGPWTGLLLHTSPAAPLLPSLFSCRFVLCS